jgi:dihydroorotase
VDVSDYYVTPGLIDLHAYLGVGSTSGGVVPDHNTLRFGVTTAVDAGSAGCGSFETFKAGVIDRSTVRVLAFVNAGDTASPGTFCPEATLAQIVKKHRETVVGIRAAHAMENAARTAGNSGTILMAEAGPGIASMRPGDVATYVYGRTHGLLNSQNDLQDLVLAARKKGVLFDVGHGSAGFWFRIAVPALKRGFLPDIISSGMDAESIVLPRVTMTNVMSKFLAMGLTLHQVIERTTVNPAKAIRRPDLGSLEEGGVADIAVFEMCRGRFGFLDSGHARLTTDRELRCILTIRDGKVVWDTEGLSLTDWKHAGPYSNFK